MAKQNSPFTITISGQYGPDGICQVEEAGWDGLCIVCPRGYYPEGRKLDIFSHSGVYILVGHENGEEAVYIGRSDKLVVRLDQHRDKEFWQRIVVFTSQSKNYPLNPGKTQYLESVLVNTAKNIKRYNVINKDDPGKPQITNADEIACDIYLDHVKKILPIVGIDAFVEVSSLSVLPEGKTVFQCEGRGWKAAGYRTSEGFAISKGSKAKESVKKLLPSAQRIREEIISKGVLKNNVFDVDYEFNSPSQAASVVAGVNKNGLTVWIDEKGVTLKEHDEKKIKGNSK